MPNTIKSDYPGPINDADKKTLSSVGIDVDTNSENKEDEEKVVDIGAASTDDSIVEKTGIQFVKESPKTPLVNKEDLSSLAESRAKSSADDLEKEFKSEVGEVKTKPAFNEDEVIAKNETLAELLERIEKKLSAKKTTVKEELTTLKKMKDALSLDITAKLYFDLKDLELINMPTKTEEFIERLLEMNDSFNKMSANKAQLPFEFENKKINWFIALMFAKAIKTHSALILLCRQGYGEDAFILARSLFEVVLDVAYILKEDTEKRLSRYFDFFSKISSDRIERVSEILPSELAGESALDKNLKQKIHDKAAQVQEKHKYDRSENWSDKKRCA
jgi:hypothetical protein